MLTNTRLSLANSFYPIGDTPAVNLLRDRLSADGEGKIVKILSLGCGDPRNLLFSLWCEDGYNDGSLLDFTFCDVEPAIFARNIILFTLMVDQSSSNLTPETSNTIWSIFYHFYIPETHLEIIQEQTEKLLRLTETEEAWNASPYIDLLHFLSEDTLFQLRQIWSRYTATKTRSKKQTKKKDKFVRESIHKIQEFYVGGKKRIHGSLAAGCHGAKADDIMAEAYRNFWETGVAGGNKHDLDALGNNGKGVINPMFSVSSAPTGAFAVYFGSDPLLGFHLAPAFDEKTTTVEDVVRFAKAQFHEWYASFLSQYKASRFRIRVFCGDAIAFCYELYLQMQDIKGSSWPTRKHPRQWTAKPLELYQDEIQFALSNKFDIIDTSSLVDDVGILNLVPLAAALLSHKSFSVLYTEMMVRPQLDLKDYFSMILCGDLTVFSLILGISPMGYILGYTVDITGNGISTRGLLNSESRTPQRQWVRIPWRCPMQGDAEALNSYLASATTVKVSFDHEELAEFFFQVYLNMFAFEDETKWEKMTDSTRDVLSDYVGYYSRPSFVALMHLALRNIVVDEDKFVEELLGHIRRAETLSHNRHNLQELFCHVRLARHDSMAGFQAIKQQANVLGVDLSRDAVLTFVVPRNKLDALAKGSPHAVNISGLHIAIFMDPPAEMPFYSYCHAIQCCFGGISISTLGATSQAVIYEDDEGWAGTSDLLVSCTFSSCILRWGLRKDLKVCLALTPHQMVQQYQEILGPRLVVFESKLEDDNHVKLWMYSPEPSKNTMLTQKATREPTQLDERVEKGFVHVKLDDNSRVKNLELIFPFPEMSVTDRALTSVAVTQGSPCTLLVHMTGFPQRHIIFPFPVDCSSAVVQVRRRTAWIKVTVAPAPYTTQNGSLYYACPVVIEKAETAAWGFHRVRISQSPRVPCSARPDLYNGWLKCFAHQPSRSTENDPTHAGMEVCTNEGSDDVICVGSDDMVLMEFIRVIFEVVMANLQIPSGWPGEQLNVFPISRMDGKSYSIILTSSLRHDLEGGSVILDAYVVHLSTSRRDVPIDQQRVNELWAGSICLYDAVARLWDNLLPALAERCRHGLWEHNDTCEYGQHGHLPRLPDYKSPLCSCGEGKGLDAFPTDPRYQNFTKYATRIALSPIFTIPYIESVASRSSPGEGDVSRLEEPELGNLSASLPVAVAEAEDDTI